MPLPESVVRATHQVGEVVGLIFAHGGAPTTRYFQIQAVEPTVLSPFLLGNASAMAAAGTGWSRIQDSNNRDYLVPTDKGYLYQVFYGIAPSTGWVYRQFPAGVDRGSLNVTRAIGDPVGYMDGYTSPLRYPSPATMFHTIKDVFVQFLGYNPYAEPATLTILLSFLVVKYQAALVAKRWEDLSPQQQALTKVFTMGGINPAALPASWNE